MKKISLPIDASRYDVRVTWAGLKEDNVPADFGVVEGFPIDPPDDRLGWLLVEFGVEVAKDADRYWSLWAREKTKATKAKKKSRSKSPATADSNKTSAPRVAKKRGRGKKTQPAASVATSNSERGEAPGVARIGVELGSTAEFLQCCEHTQKMLIATINVGEQRMITLADLRSYSPLCYDCKRAAGETMLG